MSIVISPTDRLGNRRSIQLSYGASRITQHNSAGKNALPHTLTTPAQRQKQSPTPTPPTPKRDGRAVVGSRPTGTAKATDTFWVVVTTGKHPYALPYTAATTKEGARAAYAGNRLPYSYRIVRVTATWAVKP